MAILKRLSSDSVCVLQPEHLVGRSPQCALALDQRYVSAQHAVLRWAGPHWELRDLGSRNGTFVDQQRVTPGEAVPLRRGALITFARDEQTWQLVDDSAPRVMATRLDGQAAVVLEGEILGVPSSDDPQATVFRGADGLWRLERPDEVVQPLLNGQTFKLGGVDWRFCCPTAPVRTLAPEWPRDLRTLKLTFGVSQDEEHVELRAHFGAESIGLGSRSHNYLLLTLARAAEADALRGVAEGSRGWVDQDHLVRGLGTSPTQLNIDIFRIRKQFAALGMVDAPEVVERRPRAKQLRLGVRTVEIVRV